jgi:hypothetical protein
MRYCVHTLLFALLSVGSVFSAGNTVFEVLRFDVGARAAALGGSFVTMTDDPNVMFYNPAALATLTTRRMSFGFFKHILDINSAHAIFGSDILGYGHVGIGINYINYGEFKQTGEEGQDLGVFGANEIAVQASYAGVLQAGLYYGAGAKFIYSGIANEKSTGAAVDLGLYYTAIPGRLNLGVSLLNLGTQLDPYLATREKLPLDLKIGASLSPEHLPAVIMLNFHRLSDSKDTFGQYVKDFSVGVEFTATPNVQLRAGFNNERRRELKLGTSAGLAGFSFGAGINVDLYKFDYAYTSLGKIGAWHRVNLTLSM